jgi:hypothetical protein
MNSADSIAEVSIKIKINGQKTNTKATQPKNAKI